MKTISRYIMTLALLLTAAGGAWAQSSLNVVELEVPKAWEGDNSNMTAADLPGFKTVTKEEINDAWDAPAEDAAIFIYAFDGDNASYVFFVEGLPIDDGKTQYQKNSVFTNSNSVKIYYTYAEPTEPTEWSLTPGSSANTWTFAMPGSDVVLTPQYAPAAAFATTGTEPEVKPLLPEAAEGVIAGTEASLIAEGTGIVAFAGTSTEVTQGTVMYAVTTTADAAPALTDFNATVPTAKNYDDAATVYVWYYIKGADAPQGQQATEENTFNDSEISTTPLTVQVLTNKFDIQFTAANDNTIQAGKATVTVGGTAATVTDGKLQGVKMGSEVKMTAQPGYKFRKVEVKKKGAPKYADVVTICEKNGDDKYLISSFFDGTNANITTITKEEAIALAEYLGGGDIRVVYEEYAYSGYRYVRTTNAAGNVTGALLSTTNTFNLPLYYVPAGN